MTDNEFTKLLISTFTIKRPSEVSDGYGGRTKTLQTIGTIPGRLSTKGTGAAGERVRAEQFTGAYLYILFTLSTADIRRGDIIEGEGKTLRCVFVKEPSQMSHHLEADLEEMELTGGI